MQHVDGPRIDRNAELHHPRQGGAVEQVRRENDACRMARTHAVTRMQGALDLAQGHRVHRHPVFPHQTQQVGVGASFLRKTNRVKRLEFVDALADGGSVICPQWRAVLLGELLNLAVGERGHGAACRWKGAILPAADISVN